MKTMFFYGIFKYNVMGDYFCTPEFGGKYIGPDAISGYTLWGTRDCQGVFARPAQDGRMMGDLFEIPDDKVTSYIDKCEGHPTNYKRINAVTESGVKCEVYIMQHPVENSKFVIDVGPIWDSSTVLQALEKEYANTNTCKSTIDSFES